MAKNNLTTRKIQSLKSRKKIFKSAISLIKKKGFEQVTIEEITTKAKVSTGSFYNYFTSKDQIMLEQFLEIDKYYKKIVKKDLSNYSGTDKLLNFIILQMKYTVYSLGRDLSRNVYRSLISTSQIAHIILDERRFLYKFLIDTIGEAQEMGELSRDLSKNEIAHDIAVLMRGVTYNWCLYERDFNLEKTAIKVIYTFLRGLNNKLCLMRDYGNP